MTFQFYKYQGTGNDFIMIDNRSLFFDKTKTKTIAKLCNRRFGIGADGLILLESHDAVDFKMIYYNADGHESTMCGNGGRCITAFAKYLNIINSKATFEAIDGMHNATIDGSVVKLQMQDVTEINTYPDCTFLDTGSPHHVAFVSNVRDLDVKARGANIRYSALYDSKGVNVNFVSQEGDKFIVRTYERGVEDETLSCGTGVTAVAIALHNAQRSNKDIIPIETLGGELTVTFQANKDGSYSEIWLTGLAQQVFKGQF